MLSAIGVYIDTENVPNCLRTILSTALFRDPIVLYNDADAVTTNVELLVHTDDEKSATAVAKFASDNFVPFKRVEHLHHWADQCDAYVFMTSEDAGDVMRQVEVSAVDAAVHRTRTATNDTGTSGKHRRRRMSKRLKRALVDARKSVRSRSVAEVRVGERQITDSMVVAAYGSLGRRSSSKWRRGRKMCNLELDTLSAYVDRYANTSNAILEISRNHALIGLLARSAVGVEPMSKFMQPKLVNE